MHKRWMALFLTLALAASALTGCGSKQEPAPGTDAEQSAAESAAQQPAASEEEEPVTITYMTFTGSGESQKHLEAVIAAFEAQHPNIKVKPLPVAYADYWTKLQTAIAGGTAPDTFELNYENFVTYARKGLLLDLSPMAQQDNLEQLFYPRAYQVFNYEGKQYGIVETFSTVLLFYNKDLFDKAGVAYPTPDWTWEDEIAAARQLTDREAGIWGSFKPVQFWEFYKVSAQAGGQIMDGSTPVLDSPENIEALQYLVDRIHVHKIQPTDAEMAGMSDTDMFKAGKLAMLHVGIWMFPSFKDAPFAWDVMLEPTGKQKGHHFFANAVVVSKDTRHAEAAYQWAKFLAGSPEAARIRVENSWELPAVADEKLVEGYLQQSPPESRQWVFEALNSPVVPPVIDKWEEMTDQIGKELEKAKLGQISPAEALQNAQQKLEALIK